MNAESHAAQAEPAFSAPVRASLHRMMRLGGGLPGVIIAARSHHRSSSGDFATGPTSLSYYTFAALIRNRSAARHFFRIVAYCIHH